jgi:hypothetical protein
MPTTRSVLAVLAMAAVLVLAGCAGPISSGTDAPGPEDATGETPSNAAVDGDGGAVEFYISDEENAIDDFAHLNVTITKVGLHRVGDASDSASTGDNATATEGNATPSEVTASATSTTAATSTTTPTLTPGTDAEEDEEKDEEDDGGESEAKWVEYTVNKTVDLTELKGANATKLGVLNAPDGDYDKVFVYVDGIDATLKNGESVNVKLPSSKLQINKGFTVGNGENVSFVFDLSVHKAGKSGKYILKPIISESGTSDEVDIEDVDGEDEEEREDEEEDEEEREDEETESDESTASDLSVEFQGPVKAGKDAKLKVTGADGPVADAAVTVNDESVGTTDGSGTITFAVPSDAEELEVEVTKGDAEAEVTKTVDGTKKGSLRAIR